MPASVLLTLCLGIAAQPADTAVVCPAEFRAALDPWVQLRTEQGHRLQFVEPRGTVEQLRSRIRQVAQGGKLRWIVLVGDATDEFLPPTARRLVPTHIQPAQIISRYGSDRDIASDNAYADLDDDGIPDVAIGRLTADSAADLSAMVKKIIAYETAAPAGNWRQQVNFVAGIGGFGGLVDGAIEYTTRRFLTDGIPAAYKTTMTYGSWRSPYCPDPRLFHDVAVQRLNEGCVFWVYIGHGHRMLLDRVQVPGGEFHILDVRDMPKLRAEEVPPVALMLACYTASFDAPRDCLAEEMLRSPGGPVAVLGGSRMTMPYAMAVLGSGLMHAYFDELQGTLGEVLLHAKRSMAIEAPHAEGGQAAGEDDPRSQRRQLLDALAAVLSPNAADLDTERMEHLAIFNLLGDPLLSLRHPQQAELEVAEHAAAGSPLTVTLHSPFSGQATFELVCRRDIMKHRLQTRRQFQATEESLTALHEQYLLANDACWTRMSADVQQGANRIELSIPADAYGPCQVRLYLTNHMRDALAAAPVQILPAPAAVTP